jgi:hypothetical protein
MFEAIVPLLVFVVIISLTIALFALVGRMARDRGHSPWPWWLLSLAWSPIGSIVVMWLFFRPRSVS